MDDTHVASLIESFRHEFKVFGEALQGTRASLEHRIDGLDRKVDGLDHRMNGLEQKVDGIATDVDDVKQRLTRVEHVLNGKG